VRLLTFNIYKNDVYLYGTAEYNPKGFLRDFTIEAEGFVDGVYKSKMLFRLISHHQEPKNEHIKVNRGDKYVYDVNFNESLSPSFAMAQQRLLGGPSLPIPESINITIEYLGGVNPYTNQTLLFLNKTGYNNKSIIYSTLMDLNLYSNFTYFPVYDFVIPTDINWTQIGKFYERFKDFGFNISVSVYNDGIMINTSYPGATIAFEVHYTSRGVLSNYTEFLNGTQFLTIRLLSSEIKEVPEDPQPSPSSSPEPPFLLILIVGSIIGGSFAATAVGVIIKRRKEVKNLRESSRLERGKKTDYSYRRYEDGPD
jgi:hypothetical protein